MKAILTPIGKECQELAKKEDSPQDLYFFVAPTDGNPVLDSLCEFLNISKNEKSLFIVDVQAGQLYKSEKAQPSREEVLKFVDEYRNGSLVAVKIRD